MGAIKTKTFMKRTLIYHIDSNSAGKNITAFLKDQGYSRHIFSHLKRTEYGILKNGKWAYTSELLQDGDELTVQILEESSSSQIVPVKMELAIVYEDEDMLILDKAADMPIHPSIHNYENTLANGLAYYFASKGVAFTYRCINRLDRDTTGLLIIAKNMLSAAVLSDMVKSRKIHREYLAVAQGETPESGIIDAPIARKEDSAIERIVDFEHGERAVTYYRRLAYKNGYSLVSLKLETGRTHQIRVHMKYLGYPLPGDFLYNPRYSRIKRQALHSHRLEFEHPVTREKLVFTSPLPADMQFENWESIQYHG